MSELKILKLDNNPLVWPPRNIIDCENEAKYAIWLQDLRIWIGKNEPPIQDNHINEAIERYNSRESVESTSHNMPRSMSANDSLNQPLLDSNWTEKIMSYLDKKTMESSNKLIRCSQHILLASVSLFYVSQLILQIINGRSILSTDRELNHIEINSLDLLNNIRSQSLLSNEISMKTRVLVKHLKTLLYSFEKELSKKEIFTNAETSHLSSLENHWKTANLRLASAIELLQPSSVLSSPTIIDEKLQDILKQIENDSVDAEYIITVTNAIEIPTFEAIVSVLELCKKLKYDNLGLALAHAALSK